MNTLAYVLQDKIRVEEQLRSSNALFEAFMDNSPLVGYMKNEQGRMLYYNLPFAERFQITREEWIGKDDYDLWPPEFAAAFRANDQSVIAGGKLVVTDETTPGLDEKNTYWRSYKFPFIDAAGQRMIAGLSLDISLEKEAEHALLQSHEELHSANERLREMSVTDALTGLCNRRGFDERLLQELSTASRYGFNFSMLMIDVDDFKAHNDQFGHDEGDQVLRQIAALLRQGVRLSDVACRYGGEEFAVLLPNTNMAHALMLANRLRRQIEDASWERGTLTVSIGVGSSPQGLLDAPQLIHVTDAALYEAKAQGKNRVVSAK
jgi:diguanylate cyclase (GGDEF)-like protein/PAS domain S-box-containing protein